MGADVYANGNAVAGKVGGGKIIAAFPDVCNSPPSFWCCGRFRNAGFLQRCFAIDDGRTRHAWRLGTCCRPLPRAHSLDWNKPTRLREMKMPGLLAAWDEQQKNPDFANLSFDERLGMRPS